MTTCAHPALPGTTACAICPAPIDWREQALCRQSDPEAWWPEILNNHLPKASVQALGVCRTCTVRPYCVEEGWDERWGIWGGYTASQRELLRAQHPNARRPQMRALGANPEQTNKTKPPRRVSPVRSTPLPEEHVTRCEICGAWMIGTCTTQHDKEAQLNGTSLHSSNR